MTYVVDMETKLNFITHDARRVLKAIQQEKAARIYDQLTIIRWCFNYGFKKTHDVLRKKCEFLDIREAILATNEDHEFLRKPILRPVRELNPDELEGKSSKEVARLMRENEKAKARYELSMAKRIVLRNLFFDEHIAENLLIVDSQLLATDYDSSTLDHVFEMLGQISKSTLEEFIESFEDNCTMWIFEHKLEVYLGALSIAAEQMLGYQVFQKPAQGRPASPELVQKMDKLSQRLKGI